jgi:GPH family glycoside/pentoside/hexuronide:cation symporter
MATIQSSFFIVFLTDAARLPLGLVTAVSGIAGICDIVTASLAGAFIDKMNLKAGKYRPWLVYLSVPNFVFFVLTYTKLGTDIVAAIIIIIGYVVSNAVWNVSWSANRALIGVLTDDPKERALLSGRLATGASVGRIISSYLVPIMAAFFLSVFSDTGFGATIGYTITAALGALIFGITYFIHYKITEGFDTIEAVPEGQARKSVSLVDMFRAIIATPPMFALFISDSIKSVGTMTFYGLVAYFAINTLHESPAIVGTLLLLQSLGMLCGSLASRRVATKLGAKMSQIIGNGGAGIVLLTLFFLPTTLYIAGASIFLCQLMLNIATGQQAYLYSMCGTYSEYKTGKNMRGLMASISAITVKIGFALRGVVISAGLAALSYNANIQPVGEAAEAMARGFKALFCLAPGGLWIVSVCAIMFFGIKNEDIPVMEKEIAGRKAGAIAS